MPLIAYGSLMSGLGLEPLGRLQVAGAARVALHNARRGFAKYAQRGDRFALVLEPITAAAPIEARSLAPDEPAGPLPEGLLLAVSPSALERISAREGYEPGAMRALLRRAGAHGMALPDFLWEQLSAAEFDTLAYRERLFAALDYTSPHYIPHPVVVGGSRYGIAFLAPGTEGSGSPRVVPVRARTGNQPLMSAAAAWRERPNASQLSYFATCFLGALHGICQRDLIDDVDPNHDLYTALRAQLARERGAERRRFLAATGLGDESYRRALGDPTALPARSGLSHLLDEPGAGV